MDRLITLRKELRALEASSNRLYNKAYKARYDHAAKEWKEYRKVYARLKTVKTKLSVVYEKSQKAFAEKK